MRLAGWIMIALVLGIGQAVQAVSLTREQQVTLLNEAMQAFDRASSQRGVDNQEAQSLYRQAAEKFQLLVDAGISNGKLYYDLGNSRLESGALGKAIAAYRRAQELIPGDARLEHNLKYARSLRRNNIESTGERAALRTLFFWHFHTSVRSRFLVGLAVYVLFWLLLIVRLFWRGIRWRYVLVPLLVIWVALGISTTVDLIKPAGAGDGVLVADDVILRKGNGERFEPAIKEHLYQGVEFKVLERHRDWLYVELSDGKSGWIPTDSAELI